MFEDYLLIVVFGAFIGVGWFLGQTFRGRPREGAIFGVMGPPGWLLIFLLPKAAGGGSARVEDNLETLFTPRNDSNSHSRAEVQRDWDFEQLVSRAEETDCKIVKQKSQPHDNGIFFRIDYQLPVADEDLSLRVWVGADYELFDYHKYENTFTLTVKIGRKIKKIPGIIKLSNDDYDAIHDYAIGKIKELKVLNRVRCQPWQLWLPRNKVERLRPDWVGMGILAGALVGMAIPMVGPFVALGAVIGFVIRFRSRHTYVMTTGKPEEDPRALRWLDSWQVNIAELGPKKRDFKIGLMKRLVGDAAKGIKVETEKVGYWGPDGWVEREQIVVKHRRAFGFVHIVSYGEALYVGWESHLNAASWVERTLASGVDRKSGLDVAANRVEFGFHKLNEHDLGDANYLSEWLHQTVRSELKLQMAESKIDQEIDFSIQRESRTNAVSNSNNQQSIGNRLQSNIQRLS